MKEVNNKTQKSTVRKVAKNLNHERNFVETVKNESLFCRERM